MLQVYGIGGKHKMGCGVFVPIGIAVMPIVEKVGILLML